MNDKVKSSFKDLNKAELKAAAVAFATEDESEVDSLGVESLRAGLIEGGVSWDDYQTMFHPELAEKVDTVPAVDEDLNVVSSTDINPVAAPTYDELVARLAELEAEKATTVNVYNAAPVEDEITIITKEERPTLVNTEQYLVKMTRDNPMFEIAGHRFTQVHPYALLSAVEAEVVLQEDGFRQARPSEVEEYYS